MEKIDNYSKLIKVSTIRNRLYLIKAEWQNDMGGRYCAINSPLGPRWGQKSLDHHSGSDYGLSPGRHQAIIWTSTGILSIWLSEANFSEMLIEIGAFSFKKIHVKMSSLETWPFCLCLNVLKWGDYWVHYGISITDVPEISQPWHSPYLRNT